MKNTESRVQGSRRGFLKTVAVAGGGVALDLGHAAVAAEAPARAPASTPAAAGYISLSRDEAAFVEAMVSVMCPADEFTPNGVDAGLAIFIDRQIAGEFGRGARRYMRGPWMAGKPQHGMQLPLTPGDFFKAGIEASDAACVQKHGKTFDQLAAADADAFLKSIGAGAVKHPRLPLATWFNEVVMPLFYQACFADPVYGGNGDKVFWKMVGYPGLPATYTTAVVEFRGKPFPGAQSPKSIADFS